MNMKSLFFTLIGFASLNAFAVSEQQATTVRDQIAPVMEQIKGVNGIGIGSCIARKDKLIPPGTLPASEPCVAVYFESQQSLQVAKAAFKSPLKINGVNVALSLAGPILPQ